MAKKESILEEKSQAFALRIVKLYRYLRENHESVIAKQVLRSGTSIGANIAEGNYAQSRDDFASKFGIALKEAAETRYWLVLLLKGGFVEDDAAYQSLHADCEELIRMLVASVKTVKAN